MTMKMISKIAWTVLLLASAPLVFSQNVDRKLISYAQNPSQLEVKTNDGMYLIKPYSQKIIETSFVPAGERFNPLSHAVVLAPSAVEAVVKDSADAIVYATPGIVVTISKSPFKIGYSYKGKELVSEKTGYYKKGQLEVIDFALNPTEALFGGGARALGMNRRGNRLPLYNKAHYGYETRSLQMNYTMPLVISSRMYMVHFDNASTGFLDLDSEKKNVLAYETTSGRKVYQVIAGDSWQDMADSYTVLTGRQPLPPRWAFGNFASRFGYHSEAEASATIDKFIAEKIPLDAIIFDLYWFGKDIQGSLGNFAFLKDKFPDPKKMIADFSKKGVKTILITEPFILTTSSKWKEAVEKKILGTHANGAPYTYDFYFGNTGLIDVFSDQGKDWFWNVYRDLHQMGVAGWWGDLGEPEVHPQDLQHATGSADQVHNIYGHQWAKLIFDGYKKEFPKERPFILMRAGYSGSQRFGMIPWSGDVSRSWGGLQSQTEIALQMGMQGLAYMHSDLGGFAGPRLDDELYTRWLQYGVFQPIFRPHAQEEVPSEPVFREPATMALAREAIRLRYRMLPYNYTLAFDNNQTGLPLMRPLMYEEPEKNQLLTVSDTYLWGNDFLVTPIVEAGAIKKDVYFPATSAWFDFYSDKKHLGGITEAVNVVPDHIPVFVRAGAFIPMTKVVQSTRDYSSKNVELHYYHDRSVPAANGKMYDDDGETSGAFEQGKFELLRFASELKGDRLSIALRSEIGSNYHPTERSFDMSVHNIVAKPKAVLLDNKRIQFSWDAKRNILSFRVPPTKSAASKLDIRLATLL
jgi:oligosaccharide 4-alpha-D-glucosyltransferase